MELSSYMPVLVQILTALGMGAAIVAASHIFGQRAKRNKPADSAYECGVVPEARPIRASARGFTSSRCFL